MEINFLRKIKKNILVFSFDLKHKIINEIQGLGNILHIDILFKKYVQYKSLELIAVETGYSYDYVKHAHGYVLENFYNKFLKDNTQ